MDFIYNQNNDYPLIKLLRQEGEKYLSPRNFLGSIGGIAFARLFFDVYGFSLDPHFYVWVNAGPTPQDEYYSEVSYKIHCRLRLLQQLQNNGFIDWLKNPYPEHIIVFTDKRKIFLSKQAFQFVLEHGDDCAVPTEKLMSHKFNRKVVFIIGNGFDLDLGRKTSYKSFYDSGDCPKDMSQIPIIKYLNEKDVLDNTTNWFNLENHLLRYGSSAYHSGAIQNDCEGFQAIKSGLCRYLRSIEEPSDIESTCAICLYSALQENASKGNELVIFNFNYTVLPDEFGPVYYVHGNANDNNIVLGTRESEGILKDYSFLQKPFDPNYRPPALEHELLDADDVVIFGHSLGENDSQYFEAFFKQQSTSDKIKRKTIHIITYDEQSEVEIKSSLQKMTDYHLMSLICRNDFKILKTSLIYKRVHSEINDFKICMSHYVNGQDVETRIDGLKK